MLVNLGFITETMLARILAEQMDIPFLSLKDTEFDLALLRSVPSEFAREHLFVPVRVEEDGSVLVAMANPADVISVDAVREFMGRTVTIAAALESEISTAVSRFMENGSEAWELGALSPEGEGGGSAHADAAPADTVDRILEQALRNQATDIHVEPEEKLLRVRFRIDGMLKDVDFLPSLLEYFLHRRYSLLSSFGISSIYVEVVNYNSTSLNFSDKFFYLRKRSLSIKVNPKDIVPSL